MRARYSPAIWASIGVLIGLAMTPQTSGDESLPIMLGVLGLAVGVVLRTYRVRRADRRW